MTLVRVFSIETHHFLTSQLENTPRQNEYAVKVFMLKKKERRKKYENCREKNPFESIKNKILLLLLLNGSLVIFFFFILLVAPHFRTSKHK